MTLWVLLVIGTLWLAWSNGANDNFKGVATLYGSRTLDYRAALLWASAATMVGSLVSILLAHGLVATFSGQGVIDAGTLDDSGLAAIGLAAGLTVIVATRLGMPTSTTHALTGAIVGVALVADPAAVRFDALLGRFAQPLLLSPVLAIVVSATAYPLLRGLRRAMGVTSHSCVCVGRSATVPVAASTAGEHPATPGPGSVGLSLGTTAECVERYRGRVVGVEAQASVDGVHYLSAGAVCFARAVNDTPKIAALLLSASGLGGAARPSVALGLVTAAVVLGGLVQSRRVARTMSTRITELNTGQGLTANLVTAALVLGASRLGVPVSTTHVSCGAIFGISAVNGKRNWRTITQILLTWATTLPAGLAAGAGAYWLLQTIGV